MAPDAHILDLKPMVQLITWLPWFCNLYQETTGSYADNVTNTNIILGGVRTDQVFSESSSFEMVCQRRMFSSPDRVVLGCVMHQCIVGSSMWRKGALVARAAES